VKTQVIIYSRPGCHLCEEAKQAIREAGLAEQYTLSEVNIADDPELLARYKDDIPVITFDGIEAFRHRVSSADFAAALDRRRIQAE
jgi:glutaredoxin